MKANYNITKMRPVILAARKEGNRRAINEKMCSEHGVSAAYFAVYKNSLEQLFEATEAYCKLKNSPVADAKDLKAAHEAIFPLWKNLLSFAEKDKYEKDFRVRDDDVSNLIGFAQKFVNDKNDLSFGEDKEFAAQKVWATSRFTEFQKKVETDLGIRAAGVEVLSNSEREFLRSEGKLVSKVKKAQGNIIQLTEEKTQLKETMKKFKDEAVREAMKEQLDKKDELIKAQEAKIAEAKQKISELHAKRAEELKAEKEASASAKKSSKKTPKASEPASEVEVPKTESKAAGK